MNWTKPEDRLPSTEHQCVIYLGTQQCFDTGTFSYNSGWHDYNGHRIGSVKYWISLNELLSDLPEDE